MKFLLTSAGITNDQIAEALVELAGKPIPELKIIFIITASNVFPDDKRWLIENFNKIDRLGFKSIDIVDIAGIPAENWKPRFKAADVICVGGGNEIYLAQVFAKAGMKEYLPTILDGKVYVGISAGSMVAGHFLPNDIQRHEIFPEEDLGDIEDDAMGLYDFCFVPHLNSDFFAHVRKENLEKFKDQYPHRVYATDDETALKVDGGNVEVVGDGEWWKGVL